MWESGGSRRVEEWEGGMIRKQFHKVLWASFLLRSLQLIATRLRYQSNAVRENEIVGVFVAAIVVRPILHYFPRAGGPGSRGVWGVGAVCSPRKAISPSYQDGDGEEGAKEGEGGWTVLGRFWERFGGGWPGGFF